jgi:hypothetical protein
MPMFITLSEGPRADRARPVLATGDQRLVGELLKAIGRLGESSEVEDAKEPSEGRVAMLFPGTRSGEATARPS